MSLANQKNLYKASKYDFILAGMILLFSVGSLLSINFRSNDGKKALVYVNDKLKREVNLSEEVVISHGNMKIETKEWRVRVLKSDCPRKICMHVGWISSPAQTIVCVPNKMLIEIVGTSKDVEYNAVSY